MKIDEIKKFMRNHRREIVGVKDKYSVFIPLIKVGEEIHLLYEVRAMTLRNQPGEISFPGGRIENNETYVEAAIRETCEELLIDKSDIEIYGKGNFLVSSYNAIIYSVVGEIKKDINEIFPSEDEVDRIFTVPLDFFLENDPKIYEMQLGVKKTSEFPYHLIPQGKNYKFKRGVDKIHFYEYEDKVIWGFTARMTFDFIKELKENLYKK